jgi:sensor histidine kinase regulating citrate/malate metabolism
MLLFVVHLLGASMESAREAGTSLPLCFTTGFPGLPKGLLPQDLFNSSNAVHRSGINNAVDAIMDSAQSGNLKVRAYSEESQACIEFRDSGAGLKDPTKIYDPFYTTKKIGKGSGLGLSICYGIVKEHGGDINAFNHQQGGAVFQVKLPLAGKQKTSSDAQPDYPTVRSDPRL